MSTNKAENLAPALKQVSLDDKYNRQGLVYISGIQALVRLPLLQREIDLANGLNTACYISGYRGSPLANYDSQLQREQKRLADNHIFFQPGINEDLAATAIWGSQQVGLRDNSQYDGIYSIWYAKGPGVDRTGDVFRHANLSGTATHGGALALLGDDHACESSTTCHQSELAMVDAMIPILNPAGIQEIIEYGLHGWALSRFSGCWVSLKCVHDTVSSTATINIDVERFKPILPELAHRQQYGGGNIRLGDTPREQEQRLHEFKMDAVRGYVYDNKLDRIVLDSSNPKVGIFTTGKSYLDVKQALFDLAIDEQQAEALGLRVYKIALVWPLEPKMAMQACEGLERVIVVEEKRNLIEGQLKELLFNQSQRPIVVGKYDEMGNPILRSHLDLNSNLVAIACADTILQVSSNEQLAAQLATLKTLKNKIVAAEPIHRKPYFCAGCPHNSSTVLPEGSRGMTGIGCAWMAQSMQRNVDGYCQMGGEGATWVGEAPFAGDKHIFQNLGDGTYFHSGSLAIRATVASGANITYKILYNDAVAMTGGQPHDGKLDPCTISWQVHGEGVKIIRVVTDEPNKYPANLKWAPGVTIHNRDDLEAVQRELRNVVGTSVLIYDQTCAAEKRRRRKRNLYPDPAKRIYINQAVCEGCGDCGEVSNCVAIVPIETELGRKRQIDQSACNKDYSCVKGFCPSFVTVYGGELKRHKANQLSDQIPPEPLKPRLEQGYAIAITGVGGTGVVTIGALLGMAAHLENKGSAILDMTGLAQKGGSVMSHIRLAPSPEAIATIRIAPAGCDLIVGCDSIVTASDESLGLIKQGTTNVVMNTAQTMPGEFTHNADLQFPSQSIEEAVSLAAGRDALALLDATRLAVHFFGDSIATNLIMLGYAYQQGLIPLSSDAINKAIELNAVSVAMNQSALLLGRQLAVGLVEQNKLDTPEIISSDLTQIIDNRSQLLRDYQDDAYAQRYRELVKKVQVAEAKFSQQDLLTKAVARYYAKLLAYKDEYEVARLYCADDFRKQLSATFDGNFKLKVNMAPPLISKRDPTTGHLRKREFGGWVLSLFKILRHFKGLRGTALDIFGYSAERKYERQLIKDYENTIETALQKLNSDNLNVVIQLAELPELVRGFGHVKDQHIEKMEQHRAHLMGLLNGDFIEIQAN